MAEAWTSSLTPLDRIGRPIRHAKQISIVSAKTFSRSPHHWSSPPIPGNTQFPSHLTSRCVPAGSHWISPTRPLPEGWKAHTCCINIRRKLWPVLRKVVLRAERRKVMIRIARVVELLVEVLLLLGWRR